MYDGDVNFPGSYWKCSSSGAGWGSPLVGAVNPAGPDGPVVAGGPVGPCETPSPSSDEVLEPLEHVVLIRADPAGQQRCPHLTVTLLAQLAHMSQGALPAHMFNFKFWNR